jgi:NAD(P)H-hydrate epimerase
MPEPFALVSVAEMRALEGAAIEAGTPERVLQERAGLAVADVVEDEVRTLRAAGQLGPLARPRVVALVGAGNNGRDAVVAGRRLAARGVEVGLWLGPRHALTDGEIRDLTANGLVVERFGGEGAELSRLHATLAGADMVVDGLLGVGAHGPLRPGLAEVARLVNANRRERPAMRIVAVDVPSGIDADVGAVPGEAIQADITVTFGAVKAGLLRFPAAGYAGRIVSMSIGLPAGVADDLPVKVLDAAQVAPLVPARAGDAHKYRVGRVLAIAGSDQFVGAACLCAGAAARSGCGLVGLVSSDAVKRVLATWLPEATYPLTVDLVDDDPEEAANRVAELLPDQQTLLIGPGIGRAESTDRFLRRLLAANGSATRPVPAVVDADALTLLAGWEGWYARIGPNNVLTPHAGEMARLLGDDARLDDAPWESARRAAARWKQIVVLKGPFTTVAEPSGRAWIYPHANAALATAGTGDVLAGLTAGLLAQGSPPVDAARLAVVAHALAGRRVVTEHGWRTLLASDLLDVLPAVLESLVRRTWALA